ncbi:hypothetical protein FD51_GL002871 [Lacticaseibacillus zeae DSM 20178 = KCTC 3804]|uniref:Uncharacterized protein n=1 Tax=Lacticaseibacillus zeae DSM 20178 = KCTC 3804 TaxID=1423816 RepID=A0A0R1ETL3_LACZE|nr:hypothetical protein FD51_GL002871 [Lacticaseibacillus zeae DSM 20178 = KCTC 3804]
MLAISRHGFRRLQLCPFSLLLGKYFSSLLELGNFIRRRINDNFAGKTINGNQLTIFGLFGDVIGSDNSRNFQRTRHDRTMGRPTTDVGDECLHILLVELCRVRRGQIVSHDNDFFINQCRIRQCTTQQMRHNTLCYIANIGSTFLHIRIISHAFKGLNEEFRNFLQSLFGIYFFVLDLGFDLTGKVRISQNHHMGIKNLSLFFAKRFSGLCTDNL